MKKLYFAINTSIYNENNTKKATLHGFGEHRGSYFFSNKIQG